MMQHYLWKTIGAVIISSTALLPLLHAENTAETAEKPKKMCSFSKDATHSISINKINKIKSLLNLYMQRMEDLNDKLVIVRLEREIGVAIPPLTPYRKLIQKSEEELYEEARSEIEEFYQEKNILERITKAATREAARRYPLHKLGDKVSVQYKQGHHNYSVEGVLYENNVRFVQIGDRQINVTFFDPETKLRFNAVENQKARDKYIDLQLRRLTSKKLDDTQKLRDKKLLEIDKQNEANGYIFDSDNQKWVSAKQYLAEIIVPAQEAQIALKKQKEEEEKRRIQAEQAAGTYTDEQFNAVRQKLLEEQKKALAGKSGIDADPGYEGIVWGTTHAELRVIFSRAPGLIRNTFIDAKNEEEKKLVGDGEILEYKEGIPPIVYIYCIEDDKQIKKLDKIDYVYGELSHDELIETLTYLVERYGRSSEASSDGENAVLEKIMQDEKDLADDKTQPHKFSWSGKSTKATLTFTYLPKKRSFKDVHFIKENIGKK